MSTADPPGRARPHHPRIALRLALLYVGLILFGVGIALLILGDIGVPPWDVFHTGFSDATGWPLGPVIIGVSVAVLLLWIPLGERPGLGTVSNAILVGATIDVAGRLFPDTPDSMAVRIVLMVAGIVVNGIATGMYIGARFGPGPRDGLMTGIAKRRWSVRSVRTAIEVVVLVAGVALGGSVGVGTVAYALAIGPIAHYTIPYFSRLTETAPAGRARAAG